MEMNDKTYLNIGKQVIKEIEKMKRGEYPGIFLVMPIKLSDGGICRLQIELPRKVEWIDGLCHSYIWSVSSQDYVLIDVENLKGEL